VREDDSERFGSFREAILRSSRDCDPGRRPADVSEIQFTAENSQSCPPSGRTHTKGARGASRSRSADQQYDVQPAFRIRPPGQGVMEPPDDERELAMADTNEDEAAAV
jgi:hypothetical protein